MDPRILPGEIVVVRGRNWTVVDRTAHTDCEAVRLRGAQADNACELRTLLAPFGGLRTAAISGIDLLPYQLEPALAVLRHGATRILIADDVGLGKTIQAGLIVRELAARHDDLRALIVTPAALREQWRQELTAH